MAEFYLQHRYSKDLDFFTEIDGLIEQALPRLEKRLRQAKIELTVTKRFDTFVEAFARGHGQTVKIDFAPDIPFRLKPTIFRKNLGIYVDNRLDIACNKFSALFDRHEAKDFVDIYFLCQEKQFTFEKIYQQAKKKHRGLDDYWLAVSLRFAEEIEKLPRMIKPLSINDLKQFYREKIKTLSASFNPV